jgi:hypothetical protein
MQTPPVQNEPWYFSLGVNGSYEGNALFTGPSDDKEFSHNVNATIGRGWRLRRGDVQLGASASQAFYQDSTILNGFRYNLVGGVGQAITRRLNWSGNVAFSSGLARDSQVLTDAGAILPSTTTARTSTSSSLFSYALSRKSSITWSLAESGVGFSSIAFNGGTNLTTALNYTRQLGKSQTLGATTDYSRTFTEDLSSSQYGVLGVWTMAVGRGWMVSATGGVRPYDVPNEEGFRLSTALSAGVTKPVRRNQTFGVTYAKSIQQAFGLRQGNNLVQTVNFNYGLPLNRKMQATFGGGFTQATDPVSDSSSTGYVTQGTLSYRVLRNLSLSAGSSYYSYNREGGTVGRTTSTTTYLALAYNTTW